jgi:type II secretory pathway component GspD/PulD (secretin)
MTDSAASVKRIKDMVSLLDQKVDDDYEIISLKNSSATELAGVLTSLLIKNKRHSNFTITTSSLLITSLTLKVIAIGAVITIASSITKQLITIRGLSTRLWVTDDVTTGTRLVSLINIPPNKITFWLYSLTRF